MKRINKRPNDWTDAEDCELRRLYLNLNMTAQEVANQLGRSKQSVYAGAATLFYSEGRLGQDILGKLQFLYRFEWNVNVVCLQQGV